MDGAWNDSMLFRGKGNSSAGGIGRIVVPPFSSEAEESSFIVGWWGGTSLVVVRWVNFQVIPGGMMIQRLRWLVKGLVSQCKEVGII